MKVKLNLNNNFKLAEEGEQVLEITKAEATPSGKPSSLKVTFKAANGGFINSKYDFNNDKALFGMGILVSKALGLDDGDEFDTKEDTAKLVGKKLLCEVVHTQGSRPNEDGELPVFANVKRVISLVEETENKTEESPRNMIANSDEDDLD